MKMEFSPKILAYYLPQYHPFAENNLWWGPGFTEWTNVGKAKPLFRGHYQPRVPADLGYYDLRNPSIRQQQVDLAKEAGVYGFCYWHYWFGNGRQLLNEIIDDVLDSHKPDFPFCFGWANESWKSKFWGRSKCKDKLLIEQVYGGKTDYRDHYNYVRKFFKDERYVKIDNKPVFLIYKPQFLPEDFAPFWNDLAKQDGFDGIYFVARLMDGVEQKDVEKKGIRVFTRERLNYGYTHAGKFVFIFNRIKSSLLGLKGTVMSYKKSIKYFTDSEEDKNENFIPSLIPNWDHSPRSGKYAFLLHGATPELFEEHAKKVLSVVKEKKNQLVFLKSWNEWGEGNYMEPDLVYGKGFIKALANAIAVFRKVEK